jgi:hypothetical protein
MILYETSRNSGYRIKNLVLYPAERRGQQFPLERAFSKDQQRQAHAIHFSGAIAVGLETLSKSASAFSGSPQD